MERETKETESKRKILGITHNSQFHADDVFATAFLMLAFGNTCEFIWKRVSQVPPGINDDTPDVIIYDIGGGKFDHHGENCERRPDGSKYAAFGLVFKQYGRKLLGDNFELFDKKFVQPIDLTDNYGQEKYPNVLSSYIASLNPLWDDDRESSDGQFEKAVEIAKEILKREFLTIRSKRNAEDYLRDIISKSGKDILYMPKFVHWQAVVVRESQIKFVVFPSPRGGYNLHTVPMSLSGRTQRIPLPEKWFTKPDDYKADKDKNYSEVIKEENDGLIFWNRAFACFETKEQAFRAARKFINDYEANEAVDSLEHLVTSVQDL